jgi:hypothetical protein
MLGDVANPGDHCIELSVWQVDGSLRGWARDHAGHSLEFTGRLGLLAALDRLLDDPDATTTTSGDR